MRLSGRLRRVSDNVWRTVIVPGMNTPSAHDHVGLKALIDSTLKCQCNNLRGLGLVGLRTCRHHQQMQRRSLFKRKRHTVEVGPGCS